jgi:lipopolysaccharide heptosyltransferase II
MLARWADAKRILCVRLDGAGDLLMTTPALRALREFSPDRRLTLLTSPAGAAAARHVPEVDDVIVFRAPWMKAPCGSPSDDGALIAGLAARGFDAAVIFTVYSQNPLPAAYLCRLANVPLRLAHCRENPYHLLTDWVPDPEPQRLLRHEVRRQLDLVATVGNRPRNERLSFSLAPAAKRRAARMLASMGIAGGRRLVVAHPGASAASRRYPPELFAQALERLHALVDCDIVLTGDEGEAPLVQEIIASSRSPIRSLAGRLDLASLGALLARADVVISNNTAPAHIAAAVGTPVVDLYALTNPQHAPWLVEQRVLYHDVPCRYCYKSVCPEGHHACLRSVAPETVAAAAAELLLDATLPDGASAELPSLQPILPGIEIRV